jgi:hypothetical protein
MIGNSRILLVFVYHEEMGPVWLVVSSASFPLVYGGVHDFLHDFSISAVLVHPICGINRPYIFLPSKGHMRPEGQYDVILSLSPSRVVLSESWDIVTSQHVTHVIYVFFSHVISNPTFYDISTVPENGFRLIRKVLDGTPITKFPNFEVFKQL